MESWGKEVWGEPRRTKSPHQDCHHSTESLGRAETIVTTKTGRTQAAARPASTEALKMKSPAKIMMAGAPVVGLTVQKALKVRRRSKTTSRWPGTCRGAAAGATAACELREKTSWTWEAWLDVTPHHTTPTIYILLYIGAIRLRSTESRNMTRNGVLSAVSSLTVPPILDNCLRKIILSFIVKIFRK